jgi:hypothetical protein
MQRRFWVKENGKPLSDELRGFGLCRGWRRHWDGRGVRLVLAVRPHMAAEITAVVLDVGVLTDVGEQSPRLLAERAWAMGHVRC